jgi:hypothetical protein
MNIVFLNEDNLSTKHPVFVEAENEGDFETIFIFDQKYIDKNQFSFKKIVFIYECLRAIDCKIFKGDSQEIIEQLNPDKIFIPNTINPYFNRIYSNLSNKFSIEIINQNKFVELESKPDLKRFFRYWGKAKKQLKKVY